MGISARLRRGCPCPSCTLTAPVLGSRQLSDDDCRVCGRGKPDFFMQVDGMDYLLCLRCQATLMAVANLPDPVTESKQYRLHRNDIADPDYRRFVARVVDPLSKCLPPGADGLDYGCGPGPVGAAMLREQGFAITQYDPLFAFNPVALAYEYDFILCSEVFEHFHQPSRELDTLDRLLKPGGILAVMTGFERPERDFATWHYRRDPTHVVFYRPATFECLVRDRGWSVSFPADNVALLKKPAEP